MLDVASTTSKECWSIAHTFTDFFSAAAAGATIEREGTVPITSLVRHSEEQSSGFTAAPLNETAVVLLVDQAGKLGKVHTWRTTESAAGLKTVLMLGVTANRRDRAAGASLENGSIEVIPDGSAA